MAHCLSALALLALLLSAFLPLPARAGSLDPTTMYSTLLTTPMEASELPAGFSDPEVGPFALTPTDQRHNGVGDVQVSLDGPDALDNLYFAVYASAADAQAAVTDILSGDSAIVQPPSQPGTTCGSVATGSGGLSLCLQTVGRVLVEGVTGSVSNADGANVPGAVALVQAGLAHLAAVTGGSS
jgi:hypothetical protein